MKIIFVLAVSLVIFTSSGVKSKKSQCSDVYQECIANEKGTYNPFVQAKCAVEYLRCLGRPKGHCMDQCRSETAQCMRQNGATKMQCAKQAMQCLKGCVVEENEVLDEIAADGDKRSSCKQEMVECMKAIQGVGLKTRAECLKNFSVCGKEKFETKVECLKQCKSEGNECRKQHSSKWKDCLNKAYLCTKTC